jgi:hypothetical protein
MRINEQMRIRRESNMLNSVNQQTSRMSRKEEKNEEST